VSIHGANRLGGNSLMETIVFGRRAGRAAADFVKDAEHTSPPQDLARREKARLEKILSRQGPERVPALRSRLQKIMTRHAGVFRDGSEMKTGLNKVRELKKRFRRVGMMNNHMIYNTELVAYLELQGLLDLAEIIMLGAINRTESRGAHFREDYPQRNDARWLKHTIAGLKDGKVTLGYEPVSITRFPPEQRGY